MVRFPISERSENLKELLRWLYARTKQGRGTGINEIIRYIQLDITELGGTTRTARNYVKTLVKLGLVEIKGYKYLTTKLTENWLKKKVS